MMWFDLRWSVLFHCVVTGSLHGLWRHVAPGHSPLWGRAPRPAGPRWDAAQPALRSGPAAGLQCGHWSAGPTPEVLQRGLQHPWEVGYSVISTKIREYANVCPMVSWTLEIYVSVHGFDSPKLLKYNIYFWWYQARHVFLFIWGFSGKEVVITALKNTSNRNITCQKHLTSLQIHKPHSRVFINS